MYDFHVFHVKWNISYIFEALPAIFTLFFPPFILSYVFHLLINVSCQLHKLLEDVTINYNFIVADVSFYLHLRSSNSTVFIKSSYFSKVIHGRDRHMMSILSKNSTFNQTIERIEWVGQQL